MKIRSIILSTIFLNSLSSANSDYTITPSSYSDLPDICKAMIFPSNTTGVPNSFFSICGKTNINTNIDTDSDGDGVLDSIDSCPNEYGNQSNGCYVETYYPVEQFTTIDSNDVNNDNVDGVSKAEYEVKFSDEMLKDIIDKVDSKTIQAKEFFLSDGAKSQAKVEVPKNTAENRNLKASVEVTDKNLKSEITTLEAEDRVKITLSNDGGFTSKVENSEIEAEVKVDSNSEANVKIVVQKRVEVDLKTPKGSEIKQDNSGKVTSFSDISADTGEANTKNIKVEMSAEVSGNLVTTASITNNNGETLTYKLELPSNIDNGQMELIQSDKSNATNTIYHGIKSNFKTSHNFKINDKSKRAVIEGENIEIVGTTAWQKFEEKQYFDGKRTIKLLLGGVNVIKDGVTEELIKDIEYELLPPSTTSSSNIELTKIYNNSYLNIQKGWNLISNPIDKPLNIENSFKYATISYKYNNGWIKNPKELNQNEGMWINYTRHISEKVEGESYYANFINLNSGWNLLGVGRDTYLNELNNFSEIWVYDSKVKAWVKNPNIIYRGYGFWGKY